MEPEMSLRISPPETSPDGPNTYTPFALETAGVVKVDASNPLTVSVTGATATALTATVLVQVYEF